MFQSSLLCLIVCYAFTSYLFDMRPEQRTSPEDPTFVHSTPPVEWKKPDCKRDNTRIETELLLVGKSDAVTFAELVNAHPWQSHVDVGLPRRLK